MSRNSDVYCFTLEIIVQLPAFAGDHHRTGARRLRVVLHKQRVDIVRQCVELHNLTELVFADAASKRRGFFRLWQQPRKEQSVT